MIHDDSMAFFSQHGTDVVTRIAINSDKKTVKDGALWTEESLPSETVLVSLVAGQPNGKVKDAAAAVEAIRRLVREPAPARRRRHDRPRSLPPGAHGRCAMTRQQRWAERAYQRVVDTKARTRRRSSRRSA